MNQNGRRVRARRRGLATPPHWVKLLAPDPRRADRGVHGEVDRCVVCETHRGPSRGSVEDAGYRGAAYVLGKLRASSRSSQPPAGLGRWQGESVVGWAPATPFFCLRVCRRFPFPRGNGVFELGRGRGNRPRSTRDPTPAHALPGLSRASDIPQPRRLLPGRRRDVLLRHRLFDVERQVSWLRGGRVRRFAGVGAQMKPRYCQPSGKGTAPADVAEDGSPDRDGLAPSRPGRRGLAGAWNGSHQHAAAPNRSSREPMGRPRVTEDISFKRQWPVPKPERARAEAAAEARRHLEHERPASFKRSSRAPTLRRDDRGARAPG
jgi:hypothetical protein